MTLYLVCGLLFSKEQIRRAAQVCIDNTGFYRHFFRVKLYNIRMEERRPRRLPRRINSRLKPLH